MKKIPFGLLRQALEIIVDSAAKNAKDSMVEIPDNFISGIVDIFPKDSEEEQSILDSLVEINKSKE